MKLIFFFCLLVICEIGYSADFIVSSTPDEAEIFIRQPNAEKEFSIGKTPLKVSMEDLMSNYAKGPGFFLTIKHEGYNPYRVMVTQVGKNDLELKVTLEIDKTVQQSKELDGVISQLFEAQRVIRNKDYASALSLLDALSIKHPEYSAIHEMKAGTLYLMKEFEKALSSYRKAFGVNANNMDAYSMMLYLEKSLGINKVTMK